VLSQYRAGFNPDFLTCLELLEQIERSHGVEECKVLPVSFSLSLELQHVDIFDGAMDKVSWNLRNYAAKGFFKSK